VLEPRLLRADKTGMGTLRDKPGLRRFLRRTPRGLLRVDKTATSSWSRSKFLDFTLPT